MSRILRGTVCALAVTGALVLGAAGVAHAASGPTAPFSQSHAAPRAAVDPALCQQPGQRVKTSTAPAIYLIDPDDTANWIPSQSVYFSLWDTWGGVLTVTDATMSNCYAGYYTMTNGHLAMSDTSPRVYVYDINHGGYRWITSMAIFNKYQFAVTAIRIVVDIVPTSTDYWDN